MAPRNLYSVITGMSFLLSLPVAALLEGPKMKASFDKAITAMDGSKVRTGRGGNESDRHLSAPIALPPTEWYRATMQVFPFAFLLCSECVAFFRSRYTSICISFFALLFSSPVFSLRIMYFIISRKKKTSVRYLISVLRLYVADPTLRLCICFRQTL